MYDSCNCEKSEDCMCAAVSSYVHACAAAGIMISNWRNTLCGEYTYTSVFQMHPVASLAETVVRWSVCHRIL